MKKLFLAASHLKKLFLAASHLLGAIPGLAIIQSGVGVPPDQKTLFGGVVEAFGALSLLLLWMNKDRLEGARHQKITQWAIGLGIASFLSLAAYTLLFHYCVVYDVTSDRTIYFPFWLRGEVAALVARSGGNRSAAVDHYGPWPFVRAIPEMPGSQFAITTTTMLLLLVYQAAFTSLTLAFGLIGFHKKQQL